MVRLSLIATLITGLSCPAAWAETPAPDPTPWELTALTLAGVGVATATAGLTTYVLGVGDEDEIVDARRDEQGIIIGLTQVQAQEMQENADSRQSTGVILMAAGGALLASALVVWLMAPEEASAPEAQPLRPVPGIRPYGMPRVATTPGGEATVGAEVGFTLSF
ncbi:MAG: hypothetical protein ACE366_20550 [Bradymonadia bacterium]